MTAFINPTPNPEHAGEMAASDFLLFVDSNRYLDLYRRDKGKPIIAALVEQTAHIFVTQQIVDEVIRNKITVLGTFLAEKFQKLQLKTYDVPDHLFGTTEAQSKDVLGRMRKVHDEITLLNEELSQLALGIIEKVSASADEVSIALDPIFKRAVVYSPDELQRARGRKERGNPPGKKNDPLGDQLTWEQILSRCAGIRKMWIISRDSDYGTVCRGKFFMNQFLHGELRKASPSIEVFWFEDVSEGIKHFADVTGVKAEHLPTREQIEEIKKEEESLPPLWVPQQDNSAELAVAARRNWLRRSSAFIGGSNTLGSTLPWS